MIELEGKNLDRYELRRLVGRGGMANVYEAYDPHFRRTVAVKVFKREDDEMLRRFIREAQLMASFSHPHLVPIYDTGEARLDGAMRYYIVMPFLEGGTLRTRIRRTPLSLTQTCQYLGDIAGALDYIHDQGIIHRDIKASNVLLDSQARCYLTDFGIARITTDATQLTSTGNVLGTVDYVAPELFEVNHRADALSDLYSLGVLLYEMVTAHLPFISENQMAVVSMHVNQRPPSPRIYVPQLPMPVESVMLRALEKRPELRYSSATELAEAFCSAVEKGELMGPSYQGTQLDQEELIPTIGMSTQPARPPAPVARPSTPPPGTERIFLPPPPAPIQPTPHAETPLITPRPQRVPPRRSRLNRTLFLTILALVALLILAVPITFALLNSRSPSTTNAPTSTPQNTTTASAQSPTSQLSSPTPNLTATAQAIAAATATSEAHATATAIVAPTVTAEAKASATAGVISTATAGKAVYQDPLNNANNPDTQAAGWDSGNQCVFTSDGYHVKQTASFPYFKGCREQNNSYQDFALTVNVDLLSGHSGGVFFRLSTNLVGSYSGYLFEVDSQGNYKVSTESGATVTALRDWGPSTALKQGYNVSNTLQLIARGSTLSFYINGIFQVQLQDTTYTNGTVGFLATSVSGGSNTNVVYSNLKINALS